MQLKPELCKISIYKSWGRAIKDSFNYRYSMWGRYRARWLAGCFELVLETN